VSQPSAGGWPVRSGPERGPATGEGALRVVPDLPDAPGAGLLAEERQFAQDLVVRRVVRVTHDVATFVLTPTRPGTFAFAPGQYVVLSVEVDGRTVERCYTISSPPTRPHLLTITVKRVPGGAVSGWLHDHLRAGDRVSARGPLGSFSVVEHPAARYLLLSGGSGITPTLSTVRALADLAESRDVVVVHSARTPADLVCRAELEAMASADEGLRVHWVCESDPDRDAPGPVGRLDAALLTGLVPDLADREVFSCGPAGYLEALRELLPELGADPRRCHEESFVLPPPDASGGRHADEEPAPGGAATVRFARSGLEVSCPPGTTVLEAAEEAGVALPSSCTQGICGTCKSTLLSGLVDMHHAGGIRPREIAQDKFLPCCSTPDGDIVVDA
jgi:ferredoxin-NADP reductase